MTEWKTEDLIAADKKFVWHPFAISEVRQCGFMARIELKQTDDVGIGPKVCVAARGRGLLTRLVRPVIVLMPPLCITPAQLSAAVAAVRDSIVDVCSVD